MKTKLYILTVLLFSVSQLFANSESYLSQIHFKNASIKRSKEAVKVSMDIDVSDMKMASKHSLELTPVLISKDKKRVLELPTVVINGANRNKVYRREMSLDKKATPYGDHVYEVVARRNKTQQSINYKHSLPADGWMDDAELLLRESVTGCAECGVLQNELALLEVTPPFQPNYQLIYLTPEAEVKTRSDRHTATLNFVVDKYAMMREYKNNASELAQVDRVISEVKKNGDLKITEFAVNGYASPEASVQHNLTLSKNRANAFANYLAVNHGISRSLFTVEGHGEDWNLLREKIAQSNLEKKSELLSIIDRVKNPDARDAEIMKLDGGVTYKALSEQYYPALRRTEYIIAYEVRPFNVAEAREIIKTNPRLLNLNEMFLVAQSYDPQSEQSKEVYDIAVHLYPNEPIAIINSSSAEIEAGNYAAAIKRLERLKDDPQAWNNLGVAYARMGDVAQATRYLKMAAERNNPQSIHNSKQLKLFMEE